MKAFLQQRRARWIGTALLAALPLALYFVIVERASWRPHTLTTHNKAITSVAFSPDGKLVASASGQPETDSSGKNLHGDGQVQIWDVATAQLEHTLVHKDKAVNCIAFSPDSKTLVSGTMEYEDGVGQEGEVRFWDSQTGLLKRTLNQGKASFAVAFSPNGRGVASGNGFNDGEEFSGEVKLWSARTGQLQRILKSYFVPIISVCFSPDGKMVIGSDGLGDIYVWEAQTAQIAKRLKHGSDAMGLPIRVQAVAISPSGEAMASGGEDILLKLWNVQTGKAVWSKRGPGETHSVVFSPKGDVLASAGSDRSIRLWDVTSGELLRTLRGHRDAVTSLAFSPDGTTIVSGSDDKTVKLWRIK